VFAALAVEGLMLNLVLSPSRDIAVQATLLAVGTFGLCALLLGAQQLRSPTRLLQLDEDGFTVYGHGQQICRIHWDHVLDARWYQGTARSHSSGRAVVRAVEIRLDRPGLFPAEVSALRRRHEDGRVLYIDTISPHPGGRRLYGEFIDRLRRSQHRRAPRPHAGR